MLSYEQHKNYIPTLAVAFKNSLNKFKMVNNKDKVIPQKAVIMHS